MYSIRLARRHCVGSRAMLFRCGMPRLAAGPVVLMVKPILICASCRRLAPTGEAAAARKATSRTGNAPAHDPQLQSGPACGESSWRGISRQGSVAACQKMRGNVLETTRPPFRSRAGAGPHGPWSRTRAPQPAPMDVQRSSFQAPSWIVTITRARLVEAVVVLRRHLGHAVREYQPIGRSPARRAAPSRKAGVPGVWAVNSATGTAASSA